MDLLLWICLAMYVAVPITLLIDMLVELHEENKLERDNKNKK